jgi:cytochrome c oxidase subunit 4
MSEHIVPVKVYITIFLVLLAGTALTVIAAFQDFTYHAFGKEIALNAVIALTIAITKATFVVLYFMHVRYSSRLVWVVVTSALFWMAIMFALTFADYWTRGWLPVGY